MNGEYIAEFLYHSTEALSDKPGLLHVCLITKCWYGAFFQTVGIWIRDICGDICDTASLIPHLYLPLPISFLGWHVHHSYSSFSVFGGRTMHCDWSCSKL